MALGYGAPAPPRATTPVKRQSKLAGLRCFVLVAIAATLSACLSAPLAETNAFATATDAVKSASDVLLGDLNAAEKNLRIRQIDKGGGQFTFVVANAPLYSTLDTFAPDTAKFKAAIDILKSYAYLIRALVDGSRSAEAHEHINSLVANVSGLLGTKEFGAAAAALSPLIEKVLLARSRAEAAILVARGKPAIHALIAAIKDATPAMFRLLVADAFGTLSPQPVDTEKVRVALSNYTVLLDRLQETFDRLADAFARPSNDITLAALAQKTGELIADARVVQQTLAALK